MIKRNKKSLELREYASVPGGPLLATTLIAMPRRACEKKRRQLLITASPVVHFLTNASRPEEAGWVTAAVLQAMRIKPSRAGQGDSKRL